MDYPIRRQVGGQRHRFDAYAVGIGAWDKEAIRIGYTDFAPRAEEARASRQSWPGRAARASTSFPIRTRVRREARIPRRTSGIMEPTRRRNWVG
jgi:hypothetical protein